MRTTARSSYDMLFKRAVRNAKNYLRDYSKDIYEYHTLLTCGVHKKVAERVLNTSGNVTPDPAQYKSIVEDILKQEG